MRILMIIDGLPGGGAEKTVLTLSSGLLKIGHQVSLFSLQKVCNFPIPAEVDFQIIQDQCKSPWRKLTEISRRAQLLDRAITIAERSGKFDVVFSHLHKTDRIVAHSRILKHDKVWFCVHSMFSFCYLRHRRGFSRWFKYLKIRYTYKNRNVVAVSSAVLHDISYTMAIPLSRSAVIHNPFDINSIQKQAQAPFEMQGQDYLIHVGRFHEHKRHDRLLRAYALSNINAPLVMMGNGSHTKIEQLKALSKTLGITEKVYFCSFSLNPYPWMKGARLLVLSSDCEGFGNVLIEAMICQTPTVSTRCPGGPAEILAGPLARGLSELNDEALAETLSDIYVNPPAIDSTIISSYSIHSICQKYIKIAENHY